MRRAGRHPGNITSGAHLRAVRGGLPALSGEAADPLGVALRLLIDGTGASAGAVCVFDPADHTLHLANEFGLSDDGCRLLRRVGQRGSETWKAPFDSLNERRVMVFERAAGHEIPSLVEPRAAISSVACVPVHCDEQPRACVILIAVAPAALDVDALPDLMPSLDAVAHIVGTIGRSSAALAAAENAKPEVVVRTARELLESLRQPPAETPTADGLLAVVAERDELLEGREASRSAHEAEVSHLTARLVEAERQWAHEHSLRIEQQHRAERSHAQIAAERDQTVRRALELLEAAEQLRSSAVADAEAVRNALAAAERQNLAANAESRRARARAEAVEAASATASAEREHAVRTLEEARTALAEAARKNAGLEAEMSALAARESAARARDADADARWQSKLSEAEHVLGRERQRLQEREEERAGLVARMEQAMAREQEMRAQRDAVLERSGAEREETLQRALEIERKADEARAGAMVELEALRTAFAQAQQLILAAEERVSPEEEQRLRYAAEMNQQLEEARRAAVAELESVRTTLAEAQAEILAAQSDARRAREDAEGARAEQRTTMTNVERLERAVEDARAAAAEPRTRAAQLEEELRGLREERSRTEAAAQRRLADLEAGWLARLHGLEAANAIARGNMGDLKRELGRRAEEVSEARANAERAHELLAIITEDREGTLARATELARTAEEARAAAAAEAEALRATLTGAQALIFKAEEDARCSRADAARHEEQVRASLAEQERLARALDEIRAREVPVGGTARAPVEPGSPTGSAAPTSASTGERTVIAVLDCGDAFAAAPPRDVRVELMAPAPDVAERVARLAPSRMLVNLATPGGLEAIGALRAAGFPGRLWGCLAQPGLESVLLLGMVETIGRNLDPEETLGVLQGYAVRGTRVLSIGTSAGSLLSLRQALTRGGMSASIAWDAKQASDLLGMVRPDVVIIDLALPPRGGHGIVAGLAALDPRPMIVLVPGEDGDASAAFAAALGAALAERQHRDCALRHARALETILRAPEKAPTPPAAGR